MDSLNRRSFLLALLASSMVAACGTEPDGTVATSPTSGDGTPPTTAGPDLDQVQPIAHSYERIGPEAGVPTVPEVVTADRDLAAELFRLISESEPGNFLFSPYSIATAFSMTEGGAENETEQQMRSALGIAVPDPEWHSGRNALDVAIRTPSEVPDGTTPLELQIANAQFGQAGFSFVDEFIRLLAEEYGADLTTVDFVADPEAARQLINAWVADQTGDRITDLLPDGSINSLVRFVLVNAVFFKAQWADEFDPAQTAPAPFTLLDGSEVEVEMMNGSSRTTYGQGNGWQSVRLRYWGGYSMTLILPAADRFDEVSDQVTTGLLDEISALQSDHQVVLSMPKFNFETPVDLIPLFQALGMVDPFDPTMADFSGISTEAELYISGSFHQATIEVDEFGTTATAATAIIGGVTSMPEPAEFRADRPFIFVIEHDATGEPLFMGRVLDPSA
ncbi:MAG: serpin family protein [Actinomycetia bacterium]|nr:serpin family protein [Actinomycetes bacterium]